jgi:hypothetical protein
MPKTRPPSPPEFAKVQTELDEHNGSERVLTKVLKQRVQNEKDLIRVCKIDTKEWYITKWECGVHEGFNVPRATRSSEFEGWVRPKTKPVITQLFKVKAWMVRADVHRLRGPEGKAEYLKQLREILSASDRFKFPAHPPFKLPAPAVNEPEIAVALSSDLHLTETVRPDDANGINFYNSIVGANRLWEHAQKLKSILSRHMNLYPLEFLWLLMLGDNISGTIHDEYIATNDLSDPAAVILCTRLYAMFVAELKALGIPIEIDAIHGNHPRLTPKVPTKRQARTNMDWQIYEHLTDHFKNDDQVKFNIVTSQIGMRKVYCWNYVFEHGMQVGSGKEEGFEDRIRALFDDPTFREATGYTGPSFDQIVIGNMHKPKFLERTVVNGSYIGQNELGQSWRMKPIRAQQLLWGVTKKYPRTWQYAIDLTDIKHERTENPFSAYTEWFLKKHGR